MSDKKLLITIVSFFIGLCFFCFYSVFQIWSKQCWLWTCVPERTFSVFDINLPAHLLPNNAIVNPMITPSEPSGVESGNISFFWQESGNLYGGGLDVDRYGTEKRAREMFENGLYWRSKGSYEKHPEITYVSPIADEFLTGCGSSMFDNGYECRLTARYQEYLVDYGSSIGRQMSESKFEQIVMNIDQQMIRLLDQE